jgi:hypothetical protein
MMHFDPTTRLVNPKWCFAFWRSNIIASSLAESLSFRDRNDKRFAGDENRGHAFPSNLIHVNFHDEETQNWEEEVWGSMTEPERTEWTICRGNFRPVRYSFKKIDFINQEFLFDFWYKPEKTIIHEDKEQLLFGPNFSLAEWIRWYRQKCRKWYRMRPAKHCSIGFFVFDIDQTFWSHLYPTINDLESVRLTPPMSTAGLIHDLVLNQLNGLLLKLSDKVTSLFATCCGSGIRRVDDTPDEHWYWDNKYSQLIMAHVERSIVLYELGRYRGTSVGWIDWTPKPGHTSTPDGDTDDEDVFGMFNICPMAFLTRAPVVFKN